MPNRPRTQIFMASTLYGAATLAGYPTVAGLTDSHVVQNEDRVVARSSFQSFTVAP